MHAANVGQQQQNKKWLQKMKKVCHSSFKLKSDFYSCLPTVEMRPGHCCLENCSFKVCNQLQCVVHLQNEPVSMHVLTNFCMPKDDIGHN